MPGSKNSTRRRIDLVRKRVICYLDMVNIQMAVLSREMNMPD